MEKFKEKVNQRILRMGLILIFVSVTYFILSINQGNLPEIPDFIRGFQMGAFCGLELVLIYFLVSSLVSVRDEMKLKKLYIKENDERTIMIMQKTGAMGMEICNIGLAFATVVSGFFNEIIFFSLLGATLFTTLIKGFFKLYYHHKF